MDIFSIFTLCGGLAFFLYGMIVMSNGLEKVAGGRLEKMLEKMTSHPIKSLMLGAGITMAVQSSSAVTVMLVGFVNSGIMKLSQAIGVIMGSNVGTTITSWILSLSGIQSDNFFLRLIKPESFTPILALIGVIMIMTSNNHMSKRRNFGTFFVGFAVLMFGMGLMSHAMAPLAQDEHFSKILTAFKNPILGLLVGMIITAIIQSSAASVGMLQALSLTGSVTYAIAVPIIIGQNIGTCITAVLSSIGVNNNAKRVAVVHVAFNVLGALIFLPIYEIGHFFINYPFSQSINPFGIAVVHSIFNIVTTLILFPFAKQLEQLALKIVKDEKEENEVILDERLLLTPSFAIAQCFNVTAIMAKTTRETLVMAVRMLKNYNPKVAEIINKNEMLIDKYQDILETFIQKLTTRSISDEDSNKISQLILSISDFEKIADHSIHILNLATKIHQKEWTLQEDTIKELKHVVNAVKDVFDVTVNAFVELDIAAAYHVEPLEQVVDDIAYIAKKNHIRRVKHDRAHIKRGFVYAEILNDLERISDHCSNIATNIIQSANANVPKHILKNQLKETNNSDFKTEVENFRNKYIVEPVKFEQS